MKTCWGAIGLLLVLAMGCAGGTGAPANTSQQAAPGDAAGSGTSNDAETKTEAAPGGSGSR